MKIEFAGNCFILLVEKETEETYGGRTKMTSFQKKSFLLEWKGNKKTICFITNKLHQNFKISF